MWSQAKEYQAQKEDILKSVDQWLFSNSSKRDQNDSMKCQWEIMVAINHFFNGIISYDMFNHRIREYSKGNIEDVWRAVNWTDEIYNKYRNVYKADMLSKQSMRQMLQRSNFSIQSGTHSLIRN